MEESGHIEYFGSEHTVMPSAPYGEESSARVTTCFQEVATMSRPKVQTHLYGSHVTAVIPAFAADDHRFWGPSSEGKKLESHLVWDFQEQRDMREWFVIEPHPLSMLPHGVGGHFIATVSS